MSTQRPKPDNTPATLLDIYYTLLHSRAFEERLAILYRQGKVLGGIFSGIGQEATGVGTSFDLEEGDAVFPLHRDVSVCIARGVEPKVLMAQIFGKVTGHSRGKSDYLHGGDPELGVYGSTSMLASSLPVACGAALSFKYRLTNNVAVAYIGEGGSSRGDFHEALNFAAVQRLPVVFVVENNRFAYSTPVERQTAVADLADRAAGYGMPGRALPGNDLIAVRQAAAEAVQRARDWLGPTLLECKTYRWHGHSEHDEASYRDSEDFLEWKSRDPIPLFEGFLRERKVLAEDKQAEYSKAVEEEIEQAWRYADESPYPEPHEALDDVYRGEESQS